MDDASKLPKPSLSLGGDHPEAIAEQIDGFLTTIRDDYHCWIKPAGSPSLLSCDYTVVEIQVMNCCDSGKLEDERHDH